MTTSSGREERLDSAMRLFGELSQLKTDEPAVATPLERVLARLVDLGFCLAFVATVAAIHFVAGALFFDWGPPDANETRELSRGEIAYAIAGPAFALVAWIAVNEVRLPSRRGQTIGKRMLGQHIVDSPRGGAVSAARLAGRFLVWGLPFIGFFVGSAWAGGATGYALFLLSVATLAIPGWLFFDAERRGLHDRLFRTKVLVPRHGRG